MEQATVKSDKVRIICDIKKYPVYKKASYTIPIAEVGGRFRTGQDLSTRQMIREKTAKGQIIEPEALTEEQKKKYPFVIDPTNQYKVRHLTWLDKSNPFQAALLNLLLISGYWAENKVIFDKNPVAFHGYFEDPISEVIVRNNVKQERFEAETEIRMAKMEDYKRIALIFSFNVPEAHIALKASKDEIFGQLLDLCETHPKQVKMCFAKYNPGIDKDIFILECIDAKIIQRKDKGDLYYANDYIGANLDDVKRYLGSRGNEHLYKKFEALLDQSKGKTITSYSNFDRNAVTSMQHILECKSKLFDGDLEAAMRSFINVNREEYPVEYDLLKEAIDKV